VGTRTREGDLAQVCEGCGPVQVPGSSPSHAAAEGLNKDGCSPGMSAAQA